MDKPLVTIGIPFRNPGPFIDLAVRSIFAQTYENWELILVDDGSDDGTYERVVAIRDSRVKVVRDGENKGLPARLNQIVTLAQGKYVARMDADDIIHPERIESQVRYLADHPEVDGVTTAAYLIDEEGHLIASLPGVQPSVCEVLSRGGYLHASLMARRDWFVAHPYSLEYPRAEDRELFVRTYDASKLQVLDEPLYFYRWFGLPRSRILRIGYRSERKIMLKYGPRLVGWGATFWLMARSWAKETVVVLAERLGLERALEWRVSFTKVTPRDEARFADAMAKVMATAVPGWDSR
ncbi:MULTISPECIES: glycosyltransferase family 2 protein [Thermus]|uniref:glycosyltransferase family 2 protein n=1 Tax=Thermus hydrothermalis TaxID=2908148 RepID=UPI001FAAFBD7|nr:glycosyltransferase family 2 protein [Thermus hydrothermalis]